MCGGVCRLDHHFSANRYHFAKYDHGKSLKPRPIGLAFDTEHVAIGQRHSSRQGISL